MKKLLSNIWLIAAALFLLAVSCEKPVEQTIAPYLDAVPEAYAETALGEGDGFLISVRSNVPWTLSAVDAGGNPVDWIRFDATSGDGDADILGIVLRGDRETDRSCTIVLRSEDGKLEKTFVIKQGIFVPVMLNLQISDVLKTGYLLAPGATEDLTDFGVFDAEVVGKVTHGGKCLAGGETALPDLPFNLGDQLLVDRISAFDVYLMVHPVAKIVNLISFGKNVRY